jgi:endoglucanase
VTSHSAPLRRALLLVAALALAAGSIATAPAPAAAATAYTASLGVHGGARWTVRTSVYVNLKATTAGTWKQQLWSGTCTAPQSRLATLVSVVVPPGRTAFAKTTPFRSTIASAGGVTLRLSHGATTYCAAFVKPLPTGTSSGLHGVDLVGMEMGWTDWSQATGPVADTNYPVFDERLIDYLASKHVAILMFLFSWEGMQSQLNGPIPAANAGNYKAYFDNYKRIVDYATGRGLKVVIAPWQAGADGGIAGPTWRGQLVGSAAVPVSAFTDFWSKLATIFKDNPNVWYRLITEPHDMSTMQWWTTAQAAVTAIRATGAAQRILVPGTDYAGASQWTENWYDTAEPQRSNAYGWLNANGPGQPLSDPLNNTIAEVHTYLDTDEGGVSAEITSVTAAREHLQPAVDEARARGYQLFLGEIGMYASRTTNDGHPASDAWRDFVAYANANTDVLLGWTWWAAGNPGWWDDPDSHDGGHYALTPTNGDTFSGDTVNMNMIENDF